MYDLKILIGVRHLNVFDWYMKLLGGWGMGSEVFDYPSWRPTILFVYLLLPNV